VLLVGGQQFELRQYPLSSSLYNQSKSGFSTDCRFPYFFSKSLNASTAKAFKVASLSIASIFSARQPSALIRTRTDLNAPGSRARGPVVFGLIGCRRWRLIWFKSRWL